MFHSSPQLSYQSKQRHAWLHSQSLPLAKAVCWKPERKQNGCNFGLSHFAMEYPEHTFAIYQSNHPIMHFLYFLAKNHFDLEWIDNFFCCSKNAVKASWFANQFHDHTKNQAMRKWIFFSKLISKKIELGFLLRLRSAAFWKIITALKSHMTCYNLNLNSQQN